MYTFHKLIIFIKNIYMENINSRREELKKLSDLPFNSLFNIQSMTNQSTYTLLNWWREPILSNESIRRSCEWDFEEIYGKYKSWLPENYDDNTNKPWIFER